MSALLGAARSSAHGPSIALFIVCGASPLAHNRTYGHCSTYLAFGSLLVKVDAVIFDKFERNCAFALKWSVVVEMVGAHRSSRETRERQR